MDKAKSGAERGRDSDGYEADESKDSGGWEVDIDEEDYGEERFVSFEERQAIYVIDDLEDELCKAAASGDIPLLQSLLEEKRTAIEAREPYFTKKYFTEHCFKALLSTIASSTPNKLDVIKTLLAEPLFDQSNYDDSYNIDGIYGAISEGNPEALAALLSNPAHLSLQNKYGLTTLVLAMHSDKPEVWSTLVQLPNFDINTFNPLLSFISLLDIAIEHGKVAIVHSLLQDKSLNIKDPQATLETSLESAAPAEMLKILLLDDRFDVTELNRHEFTTLQGIIESDKLELIEIVLASKMTISEKVAYQAISTAVHRVMYNNSEWKNPAIILDKILKDERFKIGINYQKDTTPWTRTILENAISNNRDGSSDALVEKLKKHGANFGTITDEKMVYVLQNNEHKLFGALLDAGGCVNAKDKNGSSLIETIVNAYYNEPSEDILEKVKGTFDLILTHKDLEINSALMRALIMTTAKNKDMSKLEALLKSEVVTESDVLGDDVDGSTALEELISTNYWGSNDRAMDLLARYGAKVRNITPEMLFSAIHKYDSILFEILLKVGGDINAEDSQGRSLIWAISYNFHSSPEDPQESKINERMGFMLNHQDLDINAEFARSFIIHIATTRPTLLETVLTNPRIIATNVLGDNGDEYTVLEEVIGTNYMNHDEPITILVKHGAISCPTREKLMKATSQGRNALVKFMLPHFEVDDALAKDLILTLERPDKNTVEILLKIQTIKDNINIESQGMTLLRWLKISNNKGYYDEVIELLIENGAIGEPNHKDLIAVVEHSNVKLLKVLLAQYDVNIVLEHKSVLDSAVFQVAHAAPYAIEDAFSVLNLILSEKTLRVDGSLAMRVIKEAHNNPTLLKQLLSDLRIWIHKDDVDDNGLTALEREIASNARDECIKVFQDPDINSRPTLKQLCDAAHNANVDLFAAMLAQPTSNALSSTNIQGYSPLSYALSSIRNKLDSLKAINGSIDVDLAIVVNKAWNILEIILSHPTLTTHDILLVDSLDGRYVLDMLKSNPVLSPPYLEFYEQHPSLGKIKTNDACNLSSATVSNGTNQRPVYKLLHAYSTLVSELNDIVMCYLGALRFQGMHARIDHEQLAKMITFELDKTKGSASIASTSDAASDYASATAALPATQPELSVLVEVTHLDHNTQEQTALVEVLGVD